MQHADEVIGAVHAEQVRATFQQVPIAVVVNVVNAGITASIVASSAPTKLALLWFCAVTLVSIGRWLNIVWKGLGKSSPTTPTSPPPSAAATAAGPNHMNQPQ